VAHDVFISYSAKDKPTADAVCAALEGRGIRCWIAPRDILAGTDWSASIIEAINGSKILVLIYSASANDSPQIRREVERAVNKRLAILPFRIEDVPVSESLEYFISTPHWLDALTPPLHEHLALLGDAVEALLQKRGQAPPSPRPASPPGPPQPKTQLAAPSRPLGLWVGAGAAVLLLAAVAVYLLRPSSSSTLDGRFIGAWQMQVQTAGNQCYGTSRVDRKGSYETEIACHDGGAFAADASGSYRTVSANQTVTPGTYRFLDANTMVLTSALGSSTWTRKSGAVPDSSFAGNWETSATLPNGTWQWTFDITADGRYNLWLRRKDAGTFQAANGQWRTTSSMQPADGGTYNFVNDSSVEMTGALGKGLWTRR
jgi:hypothetical protein